MVLYGSRVSELRFLSDANELLDVEPLSFEKSCIVRYWIIRIVGRRNTADDSELLDFLPSVLKVGEWRLWIEKFDALDQFVGKSGAGTLVVKQNIDAVTGATVSTKGVTKGVNAALAAAEAMN